MTINFHNFNIGTIPIRKGQEYKNPKYVDGVRPQDWHSIAHVLHIYLKLYGCREELIYPRSKASDCLECIEQFLESKTSIRQGNEIEIEMHENI